MLVVVSPVGGRHGTTQAKVVNVIGAEYELNPLIFELQYVATCHSYWVPQVRPERVTEVVWVVRLVHADTGLVTGRYCTI